MFREFCKSIVEAEGRTLFKIWWCSFLTIILGSGLFDGTVKKNLIVMANITGWMVLQNFFIILLVAAVSLGIILTHPFFRWSWFCFFRTKEDKAKGKKVIEMNINIIPMHVKYFGLVFVLLLFVNIPSMAMAEEKFFRVGTSDWIVGVIMSILFGITHCLVGVPIGIGIALTISGLWFTHQYFIGGVELSALHHSTYNLIIISLLFVFLIISHFKGLRKKTNAI